MAQEESDQKTEQASQRQLKQAWDEGRVPIARDLVGAAALAAGIGALFIGAGGLSESLVELVAARARSLADKGPDSPLAGVWRPTLLALSTCGAACLAGAAAAVAQTRGNFWPHLAMPDLTRLSQGKLSRIFSREALADLGMSLIKVVALSAVLWRAAGAEFLTLGRLAGLPPSSLLAAAFAPLSRATGAVLVTFFLLAGLDLAVTRWRFSNRMKTSHQEARREHREEEGDPLLRARRRRRHRDLAKGRASVEVPRADALVVNPTHIAIAIRYRRAENKAPRVTAKGKGALAEHMRELARGNAIPIVEDIPLARLLYRRVKVGREVPVETYRAVAAILAFVARVTGKSFGAVA